MSLEQQRAAIQKATETRHKRALVKNELRHRKISLKDAMQDPAIQTMEIRKLLLCLPSIGKVKAQKILKRLELSPSVKVKDLSSMRRAQLEEWL